MKIHFSEQNYNRTLPVYDRKIVTSSTAIGILREQLVKNIGIERIKGFLFRFGWELGVNDAKEIMKTDESVEYFIKNGPVLHGANGHFLGTEYEGYAEFDENHNLISTHGTGIWIDSYEALEHIRLLGQSTTPVCHTLVGYSSGFMSTVCGQRVLVKEVSCIGKGDSECRWIVRAQKEWDEEGIDEGAILHETPIVKELEYTYEQLLEQKNFIMQLADFQKKLTEEIVNGCELQLVVDLVHQMAGIPAVVDDINFRTLSYSGMTEELFKELSTDMDVYIQENISNQIGRRQKQQLPFRKKKIKTRLQERLITPILVQKEVVGYCHFIYFGGKTRPTEQDILFLERFAHAASLILLNEKTKFESFERMKGNFLEQLLDGQLSDKELKERGKYTGVDIAKPYFITILDSKSSKVSFEEEFLLQQKLMKTTFRFFSDYNQNLLIGQKNGNIVLFISTESLIKTKIDEMIKIFHEELKKVHPGILFKFGISSEANGINNIQDYYEEALIALRLSGKTNIGLYDSLGIVGMMINQQNKEKIYKMAKKQLKPFYPLNDLKNIEHLKTLYFYLLNGGNLKQTMSDLSLSMSGLRHRLEKIENVLDKDLRNPDYNHQLLTVLKALIALGEFVIV
ncbi:XylR N-terminal domain-containing protein [Neobacillus rhizophilus]|uniref:XylR N-terminal domain-containing protein n=1 Tax=Neobacillus rhizophilus TaxID=2833579 RepID=A0A942UAN7_9BACI|nr:XylR N-terminal domain-containing protein [Neobacillus rhizophilus]MBS4213894.1 XylR N-terminal domain-containing protein [Neobacillus rhizophilus]